ncbi:hypothetical protein GCM10022221_40440 [Actinocorallia aurea]
MNAIVAPPFGSALIGQTEKALNALLARGLAGTGLTEPQWVTLTLAATGPAAADRAELIARVGRATRFPEPAVAARLSELTAAGFLAADAEDRVSVTTEGTARWSGIRTELGAVGERLWGDLPPEDLAVAQRVLATVLARADTVLS